MDSEVQEGKMGEGSRRDSRKEIIWEKCTQRVSCFIKLHQSRVIFRLFSGATKNYWWQMAERRGPPTHWKNSLPASLWCIPWEVEHVCLLGQGRVGKSLT